MFKEKAGEFAGKIWNALNGTDGMTVKQLKKVAKVSTEKELYLGLGWLLREDKILVEEADKDVFVKLV